MPDRIEFLPLEPYREPGYEAVRRLIQRWDRGDAYENSRIWRCVEAFADAMGIPSEGAITPIGREDARLILLWKRDAGRHGFPMGTRDDELAARLKGIADV